MPTIRLSSTVCQFVYPEGYRCRTRNTTGSTHCYLHRYKSTEVNTMLSNTNNEPVRFCKYTEDDGYRCPRTTRNDSRYCDEHHAMLTYHFSEKLAPRQKVQEPQALPEMCSYKTLNGAFCAREANADSTHCEAHDNSWDRYGHWFVLGAMFGIPLLCVGLAFLLF